MKKLLLKSWSIRKKAIVFGCIVVTLAALISFGIFAYAILENPLAQFAKAAQQVTDPPTETNILPSEDTSDSATASASEDPYNQLLSRADLSMLNHTVNIMLIGVDYAPERDTWNGKHAYHADVMIVLSINTDTNEIHLISLPRDTYAKIPGISGIYKLNASIDCGGGWPTEGGFNKVCEAASWMLGGIPVQYYYAVDMSAVKGLVDTIGGVDYNLDLDFTIQGRSYKQGMQHMDGQAVLDYFRVRKHLEADEAGDLNRINRQKELLVAIFKKLKSTNLILKLPDILGSFKGSLYTNTSLAQTAGLAAFAYKINDDKVYMHSMDGKYAYGIFNWNFVITDQNKRVQLIKEVYGIDVKPYSQYDYGSAMALWASMQNRVIISRSKTVLGQVKSILDTDAKLPVYNPTPSETPTQPPTETPTPSSSETPTPTPSPTPASSPSPTPTPSSSDTASSLTTDITLYGHNPTKGYITISQELRIADSQWFAPIYQTSSHTNINRENIGQLSAATVPPGYRKYGSDVWAFYYKVNGELGSPGEQLKADIEKLCGMFSLSRPDWRVNYESNSNQVMVDFN